MSSQIRFTGEPDRMNATITNAPGFGDDVFRMNFPEAIGPTNNRQIHTLTATLGQSKVEVMAERILQINPECQVNAIDDFVTDTTLTKYMSPDYDYVIDAIDSIRFKAAMIYYCKRNKIPIITTGGAGGLTDPTQVGIKDLSKTVNDPLAAKVRSTLRREYNFSKNVKRSFGVECVFSTQQQVYPKADGNVCQAKPGVKGLSLDCSMGFGASSAVTSVFGFVAVARALEKTILRCQLPALIVSSHLLAVNT